MTKKILFAVFILVYSAPSYAEDKWFLMARHGECMELEVAGEWKEVLKNVSSPDDLIKKLKDNGGSPVVDNKLSGVGYVNISVEYGQKSLTFSTERNCKKFIEGPK